MSVSTHSGDPRRLYAIVNDTRTQAWCGPSVVCAITGKPMSVVRETIKAIRRYYGSAAPLTGTTSHEVSGALHDLGYRMSPLWAYAREDAPTVARWLRERKEGHRSATFVLLITYRSWTRRHWIVVRGNKFADSHQLEPCNTSKAPHRRKRVVKVYRIHKA